MSNAHGCAFLSEPLPADVFTKEDFSDEQLEMAKTAGDFVDQEVCPRLPEIEEKKEGVVPELLRRAGDLGLLAIEVPEAYGGLGLDKATAMLVSERAAKLASFSVSWGAHTGIGTLPLVYYGSEDQKRRYLPRLGSGEWLAAYALTEPDSGSDALAARTTARRDADAWILDGTKQFITNAGFADLFTVFAQVDGDKFTAFLVERTDPGVSTGPEEQKLGIIGSSTRALLLDSARVPADRLLGEIGRGHKIAFNILNVGRFKLGAGALGAPPVSASVPPSSTRASASSSADRSSGSEWCSGRSRTWRRASTPRKPSAIALPACWTPPWRQSRGRRAIATCGCARSSRSTRSSARS